MLIGVIGSSFLGDGIVDRVMYGAGKGDNTWLLEKWPLEYGDDTVLHTLMILLTW